MEIDIDTCILCGLCSRKCPTGAITVNRAEKTWRIEAFDCIQCGCCVETCPKKCLTMKNAYTRPGAEKTSDTFLKTNMPAPAAKPAAGAAGKSAAVQTAKPAAGAVESLRQGLQRNLPESLRRIQRESPGGTCRKVGSMRAQITVLGVCRRWVPPLCGGERPGRFPARERVQQRGRGEN